MQLFSKYRVHKCVTDRRTDERTHGQTDRRTAAFLSSPHFVAGNKKKIGEKGTLESQTQRGNHLSKWEAKPLSSKWPKILKTTEVDLSMWKKELPT